ncbi:ATP-binding protein [bacterium]|nr:ATP-binding protein [bacterium]
MSYKIAIVSGKGGTGKTTVAVNLFHELKINNSKKVGLVDCDVEEPNDRLFLPGLSEYRRKEMSQMIPQIDTDKCTFCKKCLDYCEFNAILMIPHVRMAEVNGGLCHSCGACSYICDQGAISEVPEIIGEVVSFGNDEGGDLVEGRLKIGSPMQTLLIHQLKKEVDTKYDFLIYDAPPGTSCPVVATLTGMDFVVLVTEPTPFGLYDLKLTVELVKDMGLPYGVVVNKAGLGNNEVYDFLEQDNIELLGEIPFDKSYAASYAQGELLGSGTSNIREEFVAITNKILRQKECI